VVPLAALPVRDAGAMTADEVLAALGTQAAGLTSENADARLREVGPNALRSHEVRALSVLGRQLRSALLGLLFVTAIVSFVVGEHTDALIIAVILAASVGLGFANEYRAARASQALHSQIRHSVTVRRDGTARSIDVTELVPGDVVELAIGALVPADLRILEVRGVCECDESVLTGESLPTPKQADPVPPGTALAECSSCLFMGTVVHSGSAVGVVVTTGGRTEFGRIALGLGDREPETQFQAGLRDFSALLAKVAGLLTAAILVVNLVLHRPLLDALLFSLAIAVGITPQLLPAIVSTSLAIGSRRLAERKVLVKRLVCIEDLGDVDVLFTDKTGTLTEGRISFTQAVDEHGADAPRVFDLGLVCNEAVVDGATAVGGNPLDVALWQAAKARPIEPTVVGTRIATLPFDHDRRLSTVLVERGDEHLLVCKGAPEAVLDRCVQVSDAARATLDALFRDGTRVVAVATRSVPASMRTLEPADERDFEFAGFLCFLDAPKASARGSLERLRALGITVKVVTGDNGLVAEKVCRELGLPVDGTLDGPEIDALTDDDLLERCAHTTVFARVTPEQKARIITVHRRAGRDVAFLGDGVNDAVALHHADVGISVEGATDVARDAADVVLLENDLGVLADGVVEGRRIFANTIKYVLMGTSSNFGNMFSAAAASAFLRFLPMLPSQILLNNLLYDTSQLAIPTDNVDEEVLARPSHWDVAFIREFMVFFGPISSLFDFATFGVLIGVFHAHAPLFRTGWFVESLATQTLVVFVIRTRRRMWASRPSPALLTLAFAVVVVGAAIPLAPFHRTLGFAMPSPGLYAVIAVMVVVYLALVETMKQRFYARHESDSTVRRRTRTHHVHRLASRWSHRGALAPAAGSAPLPVASRA
jgi:Mg2+-importing ATPase